MTWRGDDWLPACWRMGRSRKGLSAILSHGSAISPNIGRFGI
ncbi:hypothetical protein ACFOEY_16965 [Paracandidimonas soli]